MSVRPDLLTSSFPAILQAVARACGVAVGLVRSSPPELTFATPELEALLRTLGVATSGPAAAEWLLAPQDAEVVEVQTTEVSTPTGPMMMVAVRAGAELRLRQLVQRMARRYGLSPSEHRELEHLARGLAIKDSAQELGLSPETVRVRRKRVYRKMGLAGHEALLARLCQEALSTDSHPLESAERAS